MCPSTPSSVTGLNDGEVFKKIAGYNVNFFDEPQLLANLERAKREKALYLANNNNNNTTCDRIGRDKDRFRLDELEELLYQAGVKDKSDDRRVREERRRV